MKKRMCIILLTLISISVLFGCAEKNELSKTENELAAELRSVLVSTVNTTITQTDFTQNYYLDSPLTGEYALYAASYAQAPDASAEFTELWTNCNDIRYYPVLETHLQATRLFIVAFYADNVIIDSFTLEVRESETDDSVTEFEHPFYTLEEEYGTGPFHRSDVTSRIRDIAELCDNASVAGFVFHSSDYSTIYAVGTEYGDHTLKYWKNQMWNEFGFVDGFTSIEEGRAAYERYFQERTQLFASIPVYEWTEDVKKTVYFNRFADTHRDGVLGEYETYVAIPLLDEKFRENCYVLFLLYDHNDLIGEIIIRKNGSEGEEVWRREAAKDAETGRYSAMDSSYVLVVSKAQEKLDVRGVSFKDGKLYPVGLDVDNRVMIYNDQTGDVQSVRDYMN